MRHLRLPIAVLLLVLAAALTACGGDDDGSGSGSGSGTEPTGAGASLIIEGLDTLKFDATAYEAEAGEISFEYVNEGSITHTLLVDGYEDDMKLVVKSKGDTDEGSVTLDAGTYTLYCDVAGHRAGGMEAELTVA